MAPAHAHAHVGRDVRGKRSRVDAEREVRRVDGQRGLPTIVSVAVRILLKNTS